MAEQKELLLRILGDRVELGHVVAMQNQGERVAEIIMEDGQRVRLLCTIDSPFDLFSRRS